MSTALADTLCSVEFVHVNNPRSYILEASVIEFVATSLTQGLDDNFDHLQAYFNLSPEPYVHPEGGSDGEDAPCDPVPVPSPTLYFDPAEYHAEFTYRGLPIPLRKQPAFDVCVDLLEENTLLESRTPLESTMPDLMANFGGVATPIPVSPTRKSKSEPDGSPAKKQKEGWSASRLEAHFQQPAPAASSSLPVPASTPGLSEVMSFLAEMRGESSSAIAGTQQSIVSLKQTVDRQIDVLRTHIDDGLQLCRDEYRASAKHSDDKFAALEKEFRLLQTPTAADSAEIKMVKASSSSAHQLQTSSVSSSSSVFVARTVFVARKIFARGWCSFGCEATEGLKMAVLLDAGNAMVQMLSSEMIGWIEQPPRRYHAPHFLNRQLQIYLNDSGPQDAGWRICQVINDRLRNESTTLGGKSFYLTPDMEPWKRARKGTLKRAHDLILKDLPPLDGSILTKDWPGGKLYMTRGTGDNLLGSWSAKSGWSWSSETISRLWPGADLQGLAVGMKWTR